MRNLTKFVRSVSRGPLFSRNIPSFLYSQDIIRAEITKRAGQFGFFKDTEVRIGNVDKSDSGLVRFGEENKLVGCQTTANQDSVHVFNFGEAASGRYMTIQNVKSTYLVMDEVYIFVK